MVFSILMMVMMGGAGRPFLHVSGVASWACLGAVLGPSWGRLGAVLGRLRASWGCLGAILGPSWGNLGLSCACLETLGANFGLFWGCLVLSWGCLKAVLGQEGLPVAIVVPSSALSPYSGRLLAVLGPSCNLASWATWGPGWVVLDYRLGNSCNDQTRASFRPCVSQVW